MSKIIFIVFIDPPKRPPFGIDRRLIMNPRDTISKRLEKIEEKTLKI